MYVNNKSVPKELRNLQENRPLILLVELMGFLHDVGKFSDKLYEEHYKRYEDDVKNDIVPHDLRKIFDTEFEILLGDIIKENQQKNLENLKIKDFQRHHKEKNNFKPQNWIEEIANLADDKDSSEDRGKAIAEQSEYRASVFGREEMLSKEEFDEKRKELYGNLCTVFSKILDINSQDKSIVIKRDVDWEKFHEEIVKAIEIFKEGVASTYRSSNDVTLFDHSYMTGSIVKALTGKSLVNDTIRMNFAKSVEKRNNTSQKEIQYSGIEHFDDECDLDLLMVSFNGLDFITEGLNLLDVRGRRVVLEEIKNSIKTFLEVEIPAGNCIYEDENNLCFLITPLRNESFDYITNCIYEGFNEKTYGILIPNIKRKQHLKYYGNSLVELKEECENSVKEGFLGSFIPEWIESWKNIEEVDKCVLCGKMPQWDGKDKEHLCEFCWNLRYESEYIVKKETERGDSSWIDEIADKNGKIALIVGTFHPIDKWLSGNFLKHQKLRTRKDLENHHYAKKYFANISESEYEKIKEDSISKLENLLSDIEPCSELIYNQVKNLTNEFDRKESTFISGKSKIGELYYRLEPEIYKNNILEMIETKPPSPSRLHRIWREIEEFAEEIIDDIRKEVPKGKRLRFILEDFKGDRGFFETKIESIGEIAIFHEGNGEFITVERIDKQKPSDSLDGFILKEHEKIVKRVKRKFKMGDKISIFKENERIGDYEIKKDIENEEYRQFRLTLCSPNQFICFLPASNALDVVKNINEKFADKFSKALGKLSLNIGIAYSYRKIPIYVVLDAAKRFSEEFDLGPQTGSLSIEGKNHSSGRRVKENHNSTLLIKVANKEFRWKIDTTLGDKKTDDKYYPFFVSPEGESIHINDITSEDRIKLYLNHYDFENIDTTTKRFDIHKKREHPIICQNSPRLYILEDMDKFQRLKELFLEIGSWTPIRDIESLAASKREDWSEDGKLMNQETYEKFISTLLEDKLSRFFKKDKDIWKNNIKPFLKESIVEGSFFDAIELFKSIMKMNMRGKKNE